MNQILSFLQNQPALILDGGLAAELEYHGADLNHPLWSAKLLQENPDLIRQVNYEYLKAGADIVVSASYQATFEGFMRLGLTVEEIENLLDFSVQLACNARDAFWEIPENRKGRIRPLVAGSIGPYGAFLADGSEYSGHYNLTLPQLADFHRDRLAVLTESGIDVLIFETVPCLVEAEALIEVLEEFPKIQALLSFSCRDEKHISSGELFAEAAALANTSDQIIAVGVNCIPPSHVQPLLKIAKGVTEKPLLAYPNSGEKWDAENHCWLPGKEDTDLGELANYWYEAGARLIGGCCRTTPKDIQNIRARLIHE